MEAVLLSFPTANRTVFGSALPWRTLIQSTLRSWADRLLLSALCGVLFFYGLTVGDLWGTESLRAIVAAEMLRSGDWLVPTLYGEPLLTKPPGMYIAIVLCSLPLGEVTEWSARLPSALAATATVFLVYWYFGRQLGGRGGFVAALILPVSPLWLEKATSGDIDMLLVFWTTAAILCLLRALEGEWGSGRVGWWILSLVCVAGGFLTKWTTPAFFYATALPLLWWRGQLRLLWSRQHLLGVMIAGAVCLSWLAVVVDRVGWTVFAATLEQEALQRLLPTYWGRPYPWLETLLHPAKLLLTGLPFSVLALVTLWPGFYRLWDERGRHLLQALHCWAWPNMLLWSLPTEHKPRFSFPLFPALSGLAAMVLVAWLAGKLHWPRSRLRPVHLLAAVVSLWLILKLAHVHFDVERDSDLRQTRTKGQQLAALVPVGELLYLLGIKDEGLLFYFGRAARSLDSAGQLPDADPGVYCLVSESKAQSLFSGRSVELIQKLSDSQGDPVLLLRVTAP